MQIKSPVHPELVEGLVAIIDWYLFNPIMVRQADMTASHSTKPLKNNGQVAGYHHERIKSASR
jgi:hypothetical protein